jgi:TolB-like protein/tetratricopeptide (TPR) repeat protein
MRSEGGALVAALVLSSVAQPARASMQAVAVMPFKDLSGSKGSVGEAIRETVTTDLKEVPGLRVIERSNIDKILSEQNLQSSKADLDPTSTVKVGRLLGATLIVAGAYQKAAASVRLTARFVKVETGEIVGTAKVDGTAADFLSLQDRVTVQLLKSAGIEQRKVQEFAGRPRPKIKSMKTIELYGDAVVEPDDKKKQEILKEAVRQDPTFVYASRDLDALEQRMRSYAAVAQREQDRSAREQMEKITREIGVEKDPMKIYTFYSQLFGSLLSQGRYRTLIAVAEKVVAHPPPPPSYPGMAPLDEMAQMWLVRAHEALKEDDAMLREGEKFLAKHPTSMYFSTIQMLMNAAIDRRRLAEEGGQKASAEIARLDGNAQNDPCRTGPIYKTNGQLKKARELLQECLRRGDDPRVPGLALFQLVFVDMDLGHFKEARVYLDKLRTVNPEYYRNARHLETMLPKEE